MTNIAIAVANVAKLCFVLFVPGAFLMLWAYKRKQKGKNNE